MRLDTFKGIDIYVEPETGKFFTEDPRMEDVGVGGLRKQITAFVKKRRREGFDPIPVVVISDFDDEPIRGDLTGVSGTNGGIIVKGYTPGWRHSDLIFLADAFPEGLFEIRNKHKKQLKKTEREIRRLGYEFQGRGRLNATEVIQKEAELKKALTR